MAMKISIPLSVSPRWDLFRFVFPKDFLPPEVEEKYSKLLNNSKNIITTPIDYLNESVQQITIPGISELMVEQDQTSHNIIKRGDNNLNIEPNRKNVTYSPANPLSQIQMEFTVTFRQNQGLYNYWMMYESIFYKTMKPYTKRDVKDDVFVIEILTETGVPAYRIKLFQPRIDGIDGLTFSYNKTERSVETFDVKFRFNNIDIDFAETIQ